MQSVLPKHFLSHRVRFVTVGYIERMRMSGMASLIMAAVAAVAIAPVAPGCHEATDRIGRDAEMVYRSDDYGLKYELVCAGFEKWVSGNRSFRDLNEKFFSYDKDYRNMLWHDVLQHANLEFDFVLVGSLRPSGWAVMEADEWNGDPYDGTRFSFVGLRYEKDHIDCKLGDRIVVTATKLAKHDGDSVLGTDIEDGLVIDEGTFRVA